MRANTLRILIAGALLPCLSAVAWGEEATQTISTKAMPAATPTRAFVADVAINHVADGRLHILDVETGLHQSVLTTGFLGQFKLTPDRKELLITAGYFSRLDKGERSDVLQIYDLDALKLKGEIVLSPKRAQALPYRGITEISADGTQVFVQNATPATSVSVVDLVGRKVLSEIATPGCYAIYPASQGSGQFSTLCGDGTLLTIKLNAQGESLVQTRSPKFFDPDGDALFIHGEKVGSSYYFISFKGVLHEVNLDGDAPVILKQWPLAASFAPKKNWRPDGYGPLAYNAQTKLLYVTMHANGAEGSHKNPAQEIWAFDLASKKLMKRAPAHGEVSIASTHSGTPLLVGTNGDKQVFSYDATTLKLKRTMATVGDMPVQVELQ